MKDHPDQSKAPGRLPAAVGIFGEALLVAALGAGFAFAANQVSPGGLALTRDYFPAGTAHAVRPDAGAGLPPAAGTNSMPSPAQLVAAQMKEQGLQLMDARQALQDFHDPRYQRDMVVFVDARAE